LPHHASPSSDRPGPGNARAHTRPAPTRQRPTTTPPQPKKAKTPPPCGPLRAFSYGGGWQSTAAVVLAAQGHIDFQTFLFANVGDDSEHPATLAYIRDHAAPYAAAHGIDLRQLHRIRRDGTTETLYGRLIREGSRSIPIPVRMSNGAPGTRSCTADFKIRVIGRWLKAHGATPTNPATIAIGISLDEIHRANTRRHQPYERIVYPLLDLHIRRTDCPRIIRSAGLPVPPKSACWFCLIWNLTSLWSRCMTSVPWEKFPLLAGDEHARRWLQFTANIGRAPNTVTAYGRAVEDHLRFCALVGAETLTIRADGVAAWIGDLHERPNPRGSKVVHLDSGVGLSNATIQQYVIAVRSFYQFLVEDQLRERNPVRRGQSGRRGARPRQGLVRRVEKAPWIPNEWDWQEILRSAQAEPLRNRLMVALAYDGALRREELVQLEVGDFEPAYRLIHLRAETTKSKRAREVCFGQAASRLFMAYLAERRSLVGRDPGRLLVSVSRRNHGESLGAASWSKIVTRIAGRAGTPRLSTHTFRHLRLTDLARAEWTIDQIAQYAGHRDLSTTLRYIHLSGRELAAKLHRASASIHADRERLLASLEVAQ
jgi:site-specific recombinase XerD